MRSDYSDAIRLFRNDVAYPQIESRMQDGEQEWIRAAKRAQDYSPRREPWVNAWEMIEPRRGRKKSSRTDLSVPLYGLTVESPGGTTDFKS